MGRSLLVMSRVRKRPQRARRLIASLTAVVVGAAMAVPADLIVPLWHPAPAVAAAAVLLTPASPPAPVNPARSIVAQTGPGPTTYTAAKHITTDTVWGPQASPYILLDDLWVDAGSTLTLLPGTVINSAALPPGRTSSTSSASFSPSARPLIRSSSRPTAMTRRAETPMETDRRPLRRPVIGGA